MACKWMVKPGEQLAIFNEIRSYLTKQSNEVGPVDRMDSAISLFRLEVGPPTLTHGKRNRRSHKSRSSPRKEHSTRAILWKEEIRILVREYILHLKSATEIFAGTSGQKATLDMLYGS